jgi:tetratricopeptide (TPR) repeat protein
MIFEWYSGSDETLEVPKKLYEYEDTKDSIPYRKRVRFLEDVLSHERDLNWRAAIRYTIGDVHFFEDHKDEANRLFTEAEAEFDPFAANFRDVREEYCRTLYRLIGHHYFEPGPAERVADWGTRITQNLTGPWLYEFERFMLYSYLGGAFNDLGKTHDLPWCYRVALNYYYSAHHLEPNGAGLLESIIYCHFNLDELDKCKAMYEVFLRVADRYEHKERVTEFMRTRVGLAT